MAIKIEPNLVIRGSVYPAEMRRLSQKAQELFEQQISFPCLSLADLYGGKICAALDRQHPRDIFDIHILLENEGLTEKISKAFIIYLISHPRPIVELLNPNFLDLTPTFESEFKGMTTTEISLDNLIKTRKVLVELIKKNLTPEERRFILSVKKREPNWDLIGIKHVKDLPAIKWKLLNLQKMAHDKHKMAVERLQKDLDI